MADDKDTVERAKEIFVYGPLGLALYMRDTAPSFLKVFVARGRAEFDQRKRTVEEHLGQARSVGQEKVGRPETANAAATAGAAAGAAASTAAAAAPQVLRLVSDGLGKFRETAEGALEALAGRPEAPGGTPTATSSPADVTGAPEWAEEHPTDPAPGDPVAADAAPTSAPAPVTRATEGSGALAIPDYDELSASQVVDRLEGLAPGALAAIGEYEAAHRARATILGKIEQLRQTG